MASEEPPGTSGLSASDDLDPGSASFPQLENLPQELHDMVYNDAAEFATLNRILKLFFGGDFSIWIEPGSKTSFAHCKYVCSKAGLSKFRSYIANSVKIDSDREIRSFPYNPQKGEYSMEATFPLVLSLFSQSPLTKDLAFDQAALS